MARYVELNTDRCNGKASISTKVYCDIAQGVLEGMPNVCLKEEKVRKVDEKYNVCVNKPILCRTINDTVNIYIHVLVKRGENAAGLCKEIQKDVIEQIKSMIEVKNCVVEIKIDGIL